ncbi:NAD-dependent epimerase/dehydratase family protein [Falsiroseomonas oryzae]|uniref:NAD-dependent epimerase/dehydratase family protein n=1 Tax=Falsiroseomonas oryzae TaxID=2766473 RepID=UPI0022EA4963|nr:NAD-dependent epimerase/dehydratase family protein [Roseomonas sp. MO-31]
MSAPSSGARILVTGGAGFLGGRIAAALAGMPGVAEVTVLDRAPAEGPFRSVTGDVAAIGRLLPPGYAADSIIHAAAITSQASQADPAAAWAINVEGTRAVLGWCRGLACPPRLVLLSSVAVLAGGVAEPDEASAPRPASTYGMTKAVAELLVAEATRRGEVKGVALRLPISILRTTRSGAPGAGYLSDLVLHARAGRAFVAPLPADRDLPVASVRAAVALACRAALAPSLPAPLLHLPSLAVSGEAMLAALEAGGTAARHLLRFAPDPSVERLIAGWPRRLATRHPAFLDGVTDADLGAVLATGAGDAPG